MSTKSTKTVAKKTSAKEEKKGTAKTATKSTVKEKVAAKKPVAKEATKKVTAKVASKETPKKNSKATTPAPKKAAAKPAKAEPKKTVAKAASKPVKAETKKAVAKPVKAEPKKAAKAATKTETKKTVAKAAVKPAKEEPKKTAVKAETKKTAGKETKASAKKEAEVKTAKRTVKEEKVAKKAGKTKEAPAINDDSVAEDDPFFIMRLDEVIKTGRKKGYLEMAELNDAFDSMNPGEDIYEKIYAALDKNGIILRDENVNVEGDDGPSDEFFKDSEDEMSEEDAEIIAEVEEQGENADLSDDYLDTTDPVKVYLKEIGRVPLLSADREIELAKQMEDGHAAKAENDELLGQLEELEEKQAIRPSQKNQKEIDKIKAKMDENKKPIETGRRAAKRLAEANLRLVVSIAKRYVGRGMQLLDLVQEGNMGLIKAVEKFDYRRGFKFSTYATWWIRQAITRAIADQARTIRIPVHMVETINKIVRINRQLVQELGREPSTEEIAERMGMTEDRVREIQRISQEPTSLETPIGEEEDSHLGDFLADNDTPTPEQVAKSVMLRKQIDKALDTLTEREKKVLVLRFGLEDGRARTLEEVGKVFEVTRERIRQIEAKALRRLRHPKQRKLFEGFMS